MQITHEIAMYLDRRQTTPVLDAVQGETARAVALSLYNKNGPWDIPEDASILIRYRKPDCTGGVYDSLPDGSRAWDFLGNTVSVRIAPQALAVAGITSMQIAIVAQGEELASFIFQLRVESDPSIGTRASDDYINIGQWLMPRIYQFVSDAQVAATNAIHAAQEAQRTAAAVSSRYEPSFVIGGLDPVTGEPMVNSGAVMSAHFPLIGKQVGVAFSELVTVRLYFYDAALQFLGADLMRTASFELDIPVGAAFARVEIRYASGMTVADAADPAKYVAVYIPNASAQDANRAEIAASQAFMSADRANTAAQAAALAVKSCVKSVNGVAPDENGNVAVAGGGADLKSLVFEQVRHKYTTPENIVYNGTLETKIALGAGFSRINGNDGKTIYDVSGPCFIDGYFVPLDGESQGYRFNTAYAFGNTNESSTRKKVYVFDPLANKQYLFDYDRTSTASPKFDGVTITPLVGEAGRGTAGVWEKIGDITTEEEVAAIEMSVGAEYKEIYIQAQAKSTVGGKVQTIDVADTTKLVQSTSFFPSNNVGTVVVHLKLADGFAFGAYSCVVISADGNFVTNNAANHRATMVKSKELTNGFEKVKFAVADTTYQVGAKLTVWGCK